MYELQKPYTLKGSLFFSTTVQILKNPVNFLSGLTKTREPVVIVHFACKKYYIIQHPDYVKHILVDNYKLYQKLDATKLLRSFLGEGLATSNGDLWVRQRKIMQPTFYRNRLEHIIEIINQETLLFIETLRKLPDNTKVNITHCLLPLTITIISRAIFSSSLKPEMNKMVETLESLAQYASSSMKSFIKIPMSWPTPANNRFRKDSQHFNDIIYSIIKERRDEITVSDVEYNDILDMLVHSCDEENKLYMSDEQIRDEVTTLFMAGHETTTQAITWILYHLADENILHKKIKEETTNLTGRKLSRAEDLAKLPFTAQLINEALRCYPPIWAALRTSLADDKIDSLNMPAGSNVLINIYGLHHHPGYWKNPDDFDPTNFNSLEKKQSNYVFLPFGAGARHCLGDNFAMLVINIIIIQLVQAFNFSVPAEFIPEIEPNITLRAKGGIELLIKKSS
jgi:cytochrome P450